MRARSLVAVIAPLALWALSGCGEPQCPPATVKLPSAGDALTWTQDGPSVVQGKIGDKTVTLLMDTGFSQSALGPVAAQGQQLDQLQIDLGATHLGPMSVGMLSSDIGLDGIIGADALHQLPMTLNARTRATEILSEFQPVADGAAPLTVIAPTACRNGSPSQGPAGPYAFLVEGDIEGTRVTFLLDTGAGGTFVRSSILESLTNRATLGNIDVGSGFAGQFTGTATRTKLLKVGNAESPNALLLAAPEVDSELDRLSTLLDTFKQPDIKDPIHLDGFLGWTFLREFKMSLAQGSATGKRALGLERFDSQDHWKREFVGIGVYLSLSQPPAPDGIRIDGFMTPSPAEEAGLKVGDVITAVDGTPVQPGGTIYFNSQTADFEVQRNEGGSWSTLTFTVTWRDLLPDPDP